MKSTLPHKGWITMSMALIFLLPVQIWAHFDDAFSLDTIPPSIVAPATNMTLSCEMAIEDSLSSWFENFAGLEVSDSQSPTVRRSTITAVEALNRLDADQSIKCGTTGSVSVGFYAIDTCNNFSDTSFAIFAVIDTIGPVFTIAPRDTAILCDATKQNKINAWVSTFGGARINDACSNLEQFVQYIWSDNEGNSGSGNFNTAPNISIDQSQCDYEITVQFVAQDECGNRAIQSAVLSLIDTLAPVFETILPTNVVVNCDNIPSARNVNVNDNCDGNIIPTITDVSTQDPDESSCGHFNYRVNRTYTATDLCGNSSTMQQVIIVADTLEPRFVAPADTTIYDVSNPGPDITGFPIDVIDNCSSEVIIDYSDNRSVSGCTVQIDRRWTIQDVCGSSLVLSQVITIIDSIPPVVVSPPINIILDCSTPIDLASGFEEWVQSMGSSSVRDEISTITRSFAAVPGSYDINNPNSWPGENPGSLNLSECPSLRNGLLRYEEVDFVYVDACGNVRVLTGTYGLSDNEPPNIITSRPATTLYLSDEFDCQVNYDITPIMATDNCAGGESQSFSSSTVALTAESSEVVVNPVNLRIGPINQNNIASSDMIELIINLNNIDANNPTEFFNVRSESGSIIGRTDNSAAQCGNVSTTLFVSATDLTSWLADGFVDLVLVPNVVDGVPTLSINTVCPNSTASARFNVESSNTFSINRTVRINGGQEFALDANVNTDLRIGTNTITYLARDCANNVDSLVQSIMVLDTVTSVSLCPQDTIISLLPGECTALVTLNSSFGDNFRTCSGSRQVVKISISGSTNISSVELPETGNVIEVELNRGSNVISYTFEDGLGSQSNCSYIINISDDEFPVVTCQGRANVQAHPSGILPLIIDTSQLLIDVSDNCGIAFIEIEGAQVTCQAINQEITLTVKVTDISGNVTQCNTLARVVPFDLEPIAEPVLCFGDTIRLFANAPSVNQANVYSYRWTGPNGYISTQENPVIPNASAALSGVYNLTLTGANGCITSGSVEVFIQDFTSPDILLTGSSFCIGDEVLLTSFSYPSPVDYLWYEGVFPDGQLIERTSTARLSIQPDSGVHTYYLVIETDICATAFAPSDPVSIRILSIPQVQVSDTSIVVCNGEMVQLSASTDESDLTFEWIGPNGFTSTQLTPPAINNITSAQQGVYRLISTRGGCHDTSEVKIEIVDQLVRPIISGRASYCEGDDFVLRISNYSSEDELQYRWLLNDRLYQTTLSDSLVIFNVDSTDSGAWRVIAMDSLCNSDTSIAFNITIIQNLSLAITFNNPVCTGDSIRLSIAQVAGANYNWSGPGGFSSTLQNPTARGISGTYSVEIIGASGCGTVISSQITVEDKPLILAIFSDIEECTDGTFSTLLNSSSFPDNNLTYAWSGPNGFSSTLERAPIRNYNSTFNGYYHLVVTRNGCASSSDSILFEVSDIPIPPSIDVEQEACVGDSIRLNIESPQEDITQYNWTTPNGVITTTTPYLDLTGIDQEDAGQYFVRALRKECRSPQSDTVTISVFRIPTPPTISSNIPLCIGEDLILEVALDNDTQYEWIGPNGFTSTDNTITISNISIVDQGSYGARIYRNGCPSEYAFISDIEFVQNPTAPRIQSPDQKVCQEQTQSIELCIDRSGFVAGIEYTWINSTNGVLLGTTNDICLDLTTLVGLNPGVNNVVVRSQINGCQSDNSLPTIVELFGFPDITARAGEDISVCETDNIIITATEPLRGSGRWSSADPNVTFTNTAAFETFVFGLKEGENVLTWTLSNGPCVDYSSDQKIVLVENDIMATNDEFTVNFNSDELLDILDNDILPNEYLVNIITQPNAGMAEYDETSASLRYIGSATFVGIVTLAYEVCSASCPDQCDIAQVEIIVGNAEECFAPTIITPNGDGINDQFVIPCINSGLYNGNELYIYNQWGDEVYYAQSYGNSWAGTYNGKDLPTGTYYYLFKPNRDTEAIKGFLIIER